MAKAYTITFLFLLEAFFSFGQSNNQSIDSIVRRKVEVIAYQPQIENGISGLVFLEIRNISGNISIKTVFSSYKDNWFESKSGLASRLAADPALKNVDFHFLVPVSFECSVDGKKVLYKPGRVEKREIIRLKRNGKTTRVVRISSSLNNSPARETS